MSCTVKGVDLSKKEDRAAVVRSAFNSNAMEGIFPSEETVKLFDRYIAGSISLSDLKAEILLKSRR